MLQNKNLFFMSIVLIVSLCIPTVFADDFSQYRYAVFDTYANGSLGWMMGNDSNMFGGINPSSWTDGNATAGSMSDDPQVLNTLYVNKGYAGKNAMIFSDVDNYYSSTNGRIATALFQVKNNTGQDIVWSPDYYYSAYSGWNEYASVAVNGVNVATHTGSGTAVTPITIKANQTSNVIFTSTTNTPVGPGVRGNQLGFRNNSLDLPTGLSFVDELSSNPYRWASFNTYDNAEMGWMMGNNANMFGGVNPSTWTDGNATAGNMSTNPEVLKTLFTNKGYAGKNAMVTSNVDDYYSSTNGRVTAALFQIKNTTGQDMVWNPSFYYSTESGWSERASVAVNGVNVATYTGSGTATPSIVLKANQTNNVIFTSTTTVGSYANNTYTRGNQLGFFNNSLDLPSGLLFVDELGGNPYRTATFDTYDNNTLGWMMGNNANMFGGVNPSNWTDGNYRAVHMSLDPQTLATLFTHKNYAGNNAMISSDVEAYYSSTNGKITAALFQIENTTSNSIVWSPDYYYSAYSGWSEYAGVAVNGQEVALHSSSGSNTSLNITLPGNQTSYVIFTSATGSTSGHIGDGQYVRGNQLGFFNDTLALPTGLRFVDNLAMTEVAVPEPGTLVLFTLCLLGFLVSKKRR